MQSIANQNWMAICNPSSAEENFGEPPEKPPRYLAKTKTELAAELREKYEAGRVVSLQEQQRVLQRELEIEWKNSQSELHKLRQVASPPESPPRPDSYNIYLESERKRRIKALWDTYRTREIQRNFDQDIVKVRYNVHERHRYFLASGERAPEEACPHNGDNRRKIMQGVRGLRETAKERLAMLSEDASHRVHELGNVTKKTLGILDP